MAIVLPNIPTDNDLVTSNKRMTDAWVKWLVFLLQIIQTSVTQFSRVRQTDLSASLGVTNFPSGLLASGLYRLTVTAKVTRPATTSSSLQVHLHATDGAAVQFDSAAVTSNALGTIVTLTALVEAVQAATLGVSATYASAGATPMLYKLYATAEAFPQ